MPDEDKTWDLEQVRKGWSARQLPESLNGKSFLDVGCWSAGYAKVAQEKGADRVLAVDLVRSTKLHDVPFLQMDIMGDHFLMLDAFDVVLCKGVLYHVPNPVGLLSRLFTKTREVLYLGTSVSRSEETILEMFVSDQKNVTNWFAPSVSALSQMLEIVGFTDVEVVHKRSGRLFEKACLRAIPGNGGTRLLPRVVKHMTN